MFRNPLEWQFLPPRWDARAGSAKAPCSRKENCWWRLMLKPSSVTTTTQSKAATPARRGTQSQRSFREWCPALRDPNTGLFFFCKSFQQVQGWQFSCFYQYSTPIFGVNETMQHVKIRSCFCYLNSQTCFPAWFWQMTHPAEKGNCIVRDQALFWSRSMKCKGSQLRADAPSFRSLWFHISWNQLGRNLTGHLE